MAALSRKLRSISGPLGHEGIAWWCPGCDGAHIIYTKNPSGPVWQWDGNVDAPTVSPSILVYETKVSPRCHSFLRGGVIEFLGDCTHAMAGQKVPLPDFGADW